jgi:hypothetical protein
MLRRFDGLSPKPDHPGRGRVQHIAEFWNRLRVCEEIGRTSWEELEPLEREVTECLSREPPDIDRADSLTAKAMLLIVGRYEL